MASSIVRTALRRVRAGDPGQVLDRMPAPYVAVPPGGAHVASMLSPGRDLAEMAAFGVNPALHSVVHRLATATAKVPWHLYRTRDGRGRLASGEDRREEPNHPAALLWEQPNPAFTRQAFTESFQQHLDLTGEAYWVIEGSGTDPMRGGRLELWFQRPDRMLPIPGRSEFLDGWVLRAPTGDDIGLFPEEVVQLRYPDPMNPYRGLGPVQALLGLLRSAQQGTEYARMFFENSALPSLAIMFEEALEDEEWDRFQKRWAEQHRGVHNAHRTAIVENAKLQPIGMSFRDMQFVEALQATTDQILLAFGMGKTMVGQTEDVNRATAEAAEYVFARYQLVDRLERIKQQLNRRILPLFGTAGQGVEFDYEDPVPEDKAAEREDMTSRVTAFKTLVDAGVDPDAAADTVGLPPMAMAPRPAAPPAEPALEPA